MNLFQLTKKIDIIVEDPNSRQRHIYFSRIEDIGADSITIAAPYRRGFYLPPWPGRKFHGRIVADNCAYLFTSTIVRFVTDPIPLWVIATPADLKKIQMRSHVRLDIVLDVTLELAGEEEDGNLVVSTLTRDISAGGLRVAVAQPLPPGTKLKVILPLPEASTIEAMAEVIRDIPPDNPGDKHAAAVAFTTIKEKDRGEIVKFIFKKQVERRKKEQELFK